MPTDPPNFDSSRSVNIVQIKKDLAEAHGPNRTRSVQQWATTFAEHTEALVSHVEWLERATASYRTCLDHLRYIRTNREWGKSVRYPELDEFLDGIER